MHLARVLFFSFWHAAIALVSFCAWVSGFAAWAASVPELDGARPPVPVLRLAVVRVPLGGGGCAAEADSATLVSPASVVRPSDPVKPPGAGERKATPTVIA